MNVNPNETFDLALVTEFDSLADLDIYAKHPDHVAVAKIIGAVKADRSCVDFEF
ncbi:MAG: Dabb family protein [Tannerellaceae bacterium]